jgi:hypothetical protein
MLCRKETITYRAKPKIYDIDKYLISISNIIWQDIDYLQFTLKGNFLQIRNVYLSASDSSIFGISASYFNPFSAIKNLSSENVPFTAIKVNLFTYNERYLVFDFPEVPLNIGYIDVIIENEAGYSKMTNELYVKEISACGITENFQKPSISGIQITQ